MTQEEITEGNKIIAEFMGFKYYPNDSINGMMGVLKKENGACFHASIIDESFCINYHSSWDWLMSVVEKIMATKFEDGENIYLRTFGMRGVDECDMVRFNRYQLFQAGTLIEATYMAVVDYIKGLTSPPTQNIDRR